jgi:hypothetical protein
MADSNAIDAAIVARLASDAALTALLPDGVWVDVAEQGKKRFARVTLLSAFDSGQMGAPGARRATEEVIYAVTAVTFGTSSTPAKQAAARIDVLLEDVELAIDGYAHLSTERIERIRETEEDELDATIRWQHRGGRYRLLVAPTGGIA